MKPYTCIVNDLVLPINFLRKMNYRYHILLILIVTILESFTLTDYLEYGTNYHLLTCHYLLSKPLFTTIYVNILLNTFHPVIRVPSTSAAGVVTVTTQIFQ